MRIIAVMALAMFLQSACHKQTEQDKVKKVITAIQKAAEEKEVKTILGLLSKTYRDPQDYDYDGIKGLLLFYFYRHQKVSVYITDLDVNTEDTSARAMFQAVLSGGKKVEAPSDLLPEALGIYNFDVSFVKESGDWKVSSAKWTRAAEGAP